MLAFFGGVLQQAMLTSLPTCPGLELAAAYHPAAAGELVGGDWYGAYPLADPSDPVTAPGVAFTIGDITGHDMKAATIMGQVRSMLRQADLHDSLSPAAVVTAVERVCGQLSFDTSGTLVHAHLTPVPRRQRQLDPELD